MKKLFVLLFSLLTMAVAAQTTSTKSPENYVFNLDEKAQVKTTKESLVKTSKLTSNTCVYKGAKHPVYMSSRGKYFIVVLSRNGNYYKKYIS
jgi:hypothetical protein